MTAPTPILTLEELDEIERGPVTPMTVEVLVNSHRVLLQRREAAGVKDTSLNAEEQALDDALARLLKPWPADIINDENIGPITMRQAVLIRRSIRNAAKQRYWNEFYIKEVLTPRQEAGELELIDQRDAAEEAFSQAYFLVTGRSPEWSNRFGHAEALEEIEDACTLLRKSIPTPPTPPSVVEFVRQRVEEIRSNDGGLWRSCSGCYETEDGQNVHGFLFSPTFGCVLGSGCGECGGIGAIWDQTDYAQMAAELSATTPPTPPSRKEIFSVLSKYFLNQRAIHECADSLVALINGASNAG